MSHPVDSVTSRSRVELASVGVCHDATHAYRGDKMSKLRLGFLCLVVAAAVVAEPQLQRKLHLSLQALAIRPGSTLQAGGTVAGGFGLAIENIDSLLERIEAELGS